MKWYSISKPRLTSRSPPRDDSPAVPSPVSPPSPSPTRSTSSVRGCRSSPPPSRVSPPRRSRRSCQECGRHWCTCTRPKAVYRHCTGASSLRWLEWHLTLDSTSWCTRACGNTSPLKDGITRRRSASCVRVPSPAPWRRQRRILCEYSLCCADPYAFAYLRNSLMIDIFLQ